jgi:hypothetical protein
MAVVGGAVFNELLIRPIQTTDATTKHFELMTVEPNCVITFDMFVNAMSSAGTVDAFRLIATYRNVGAGAVIVGAQTTLHTAGGPYTAAFSTSAARVIMNITGAAATTINWACTGHALKSISG